MSKLRTSEPKMEPTFLKQLDIYVANFGKYKVRIRNTLLNLTTEMSSFDMRYNFTSMPISVDIEK